MLTVNTGEANTRKAKELLRPNAASGQNNKMHMAHKNFKIGRWFCHARAAQFWENLPATHACVGARGLGKIPAVWLEFLMLPGSYPTALP